MKIWLLVLMVISSTNFTSAQAEFPVMDARWCYFGQGDTGQSYGNYCFSPSELVELNGKIYSKILVTNSPQYNPSEEVLYREENKKFYLIPENETEEILLYDFNLIVGDTFVATYGFGINDSLILEVETVDTVITVDGISRKKITLSNGFGGNQGTWLEGIGSLGWTFTYPSYSGSVSGSLFFNCHSQGGVTLYPINTTIDCDLVINTKETEEQLSLVISPNPIEDYFNIDFKNIKPNHLAILDLNGKIIYEKNINPEQNTLQISKKLIAGIYFVQVYRNDGVILTKKFIKI